MASPATLVVADRTPDVLDGLVCPEPDNSFPPINFVYRHLHDALRLELKRLADLVHSIEQRIVSKSVDRDLSVLYDEYHLLVQVNRCHSSVEDEVVYPALERKVQNITPSYSVEHGEEDFLLDSLQDLLAAVIRANSSDKVHLMREVVCKVDEVSVTLQKHLRKEEEQLFPLLLTHFSFDEQAELVVQFVCCIPVLSIPNVLRWLCVGVSHAEKRSLLSNFRRLRIDHQLSRLICLWLESCLFDSGEIPLLSAVPSAAVSTASTGAPSACKTDAEISDPLDLLEHLHRGLIQTLKHFVAGVDAMQRRGRPDALTLAELTSLWHFVSAVVAFHRLSEDLFVLPTARALPAGAVGTCDQCEDEHRSEAQALTALGRLLSDLAACCRRGADAADLLKQLHDNAEKTLKSARMHMSREETDVLPALRQHLSTDEKFTLVRHSLQTLPLRLLERIVPWLAQQVGPAGLSVLVQANAPVDTLLVQLIGKWAQRAFAGGGIDNGADMHSAFPATTCMPQVVVLAKARLLKSDRSVIPVSEAESRSCQHPSSSSADEATNQRAAKRPRSVSPTPAPAAAAAANPVDHIFQFHKALRQELHNIEQEARLLQRMVACASPSSSPRGLNGHAAGSPRVQPADAAAADHVFTRVRLLEGRLRFLEGIYKAHSESEDEVVFPALEAKQTLQNVSTFYTMDHQEEAKLFAELRSIMDELVGCEAVGALQEADAEAARLQRRALLVSRLRQKIASARAALDTHMRAEEANIWPLFSEHFTIEEQSALVGAVIGRTGADVLQALIPWVMGSVSDAEKTAMFDSLRQATVNTHFDEWMKKMVPVDILKEGDTARAAERGRAAWETAEGQEGVWPESKAVADVTAYQPGWSDIFRMNATQLEAAAAGSDGTGDMVGERDLRRSYLTHNLLVSCFLVAQQQRMGQAAVVTPEASTAPRVAGDGTPHGGCKHYRAACALVAPCCGAVVACRLCHDEAGECGVAFDQYAVREMRCNLCNTLQLVAQRCSKCKASMARYYCSICHLFDDDPTKAIYHCPFCNMCRRGKGLGLDSFHCMTCNACMSLELYNRHTCRERAMESNCPICHEDLFASASPVKELPCGHFMHSACFAQYTMYKYTCPVCCKSVGDLTLYFRMLDRLLLTEKMPPELQGRTQRIYCNDCAEQSSVPYHFVYHKCNACSSYNTRVL